MPLQANQSRELALQRILMLWILTGLVFMLLPGTFMGVWNLISITESHRTGHIPPGWIQAHGHAQIFGWIGSFILGIGFYSLSKMSGSKGVPISRPWASWAAWTTGVALRWLGSAYGWHWRIALPFSAALELGAFVLFVISVRAHRGSEPASAKPRLPVWMILVMISTFGFFAALAANAAASLQLALAGSSPAVSAAEDQALLYLFTWGFPVFAVWGFSARWLPVFLGLREPSRVPLLAAAAVNATGVLAAFFSQLLAAAVLTTIGAALAARGLHVFSRAHQPAKTKGVHWTFPYFVRLAYVWLLIAAVLSIFASRWDRAGGIWGASRHALTVGFLAVMVFSVGQRVLPAFCGMRVLFSPKLMFLSLGLLSAGCLLRVVSEIAAYESYLPVMWAVLPVSAVIEMSAVTLFAVSLIATFRQTPPHLRAVTEIAPASGPI
jgi:hypothetical protein